MSVNGPGWGTPEDEPIARRKPWVPRSCTGLTAHWCPNHGTCVCTQPGAHGGRVWRDSLDTPDCPLHGTDTDHPRTRRVRILKRRPS